MRQVSAIKQRLGVVESIKTVVGDDNWVLIDKCACKCLLEGAVGGVASAPAAMAALGGAVVDTRARFTIFMFHGGRRVRRGRLMRGAQSGRRDGTGGEGRGS